jgi:uncharacterized protein
MENGTGNSLEISVHGDDEAGEYRITLPGTEGTARLSWTGGPGIRAATHTFVPDSLRGRGIAGVLVDRLVADARQQGFRIVPRCSYVDAAFRRHPEWADVLAV